MTLTIDLRECNTLHGLLSRRLLILVENPSGLAEVEGITVVELYERGRAAVSTNAETFSPNHVRHPVACHMLPRRYELSIGGDCL